MIGKLKGIIDHISEDHIILDINGVGYQVFISTNILSKLSISEEKIFFIEMQVREDSITLFGFVTEADKKLFNLLKTVQGVGAKLALSILSKLTLEELQNIVLLEDYKSMQAVHGVGAKVANRIVSELKDKIEKIFKNDFKNKIIKENTNKDIYTNNIIEARNALVSLGYTQNDARNAINYANNHLEKDSSVEELIKKSLQYFNDKINK